MDEQRAAKHTIAVTNPAVIRAAIALRISALAFWRFDVAPLTMTDLSFNRNLWTLRCAACPLREAERAKEQEVDI